MAIWTLLSLYQLIRDQENLTSSWQYLKMSLSGVHALILCMVLFFMLLNWWLEIRKWQLLVQPYENCSFYTASKTVLGSLSFGLSTPNRIGEYGMRSAFMKKKNRKNGVLLTLLSSVAQLLVTLAAGILSILFLPAFLADTDSITLISKPILLYICFFLLILFLGMLIFYYKTGMILGYLQRLRMMKKVLPEITDLQLITNPLRFQILFLSILRYMVFAFQQVLVWQVFGAGMDLYSAFVTIACIYLMMAFVPTIALAELGIRGQVAVWVAGLFTTNYLAIVSGIALIWILNLFIPALVGTFFLWNLRQKSKPREI